MVKFCIVTALNDKGKIAIDKHIFETLKASRINKMILRKMGYKQEIVSERPYTLRVEINNPTYRNMLELRDFKTRIVEALKLNGADENQDYTIEEE